MEEATSHCEVCTQSHALSLPIKPTFASSPSRFNPQLPHPPTGASSKAETESPSCPDRSSEEKAERFPSPFHLSQLADQLPTPVQLADQLPHLVRLVKRFPPLVQLVEQLPPPVQLASLPPTTSSPLSTVPPVFDPCMSFLSLSPPYM